MPDPTAFGYGDLHFAWGDHICAIFDDHLQQMEVMLPYVAGGLRAAQRCVWAGPGDSCRHFRRSLAEIGGDLPTLEASGQLIVMPDVDYYLQEGLFEPEHTLALLRTLLLDGQRQGYETMRVSVDVSWVERHRVEAVMWEDFEVRLNDALVDLPVVVVCQYDRRQVSGSLIVAALRTHPAVILGDAFHENPFYVSTYGGPMSDVM